MPTAPRRRSAAGRGVSQSWFCKWKDGQLPPRAARRERLKAEIARLFAAREGKDGSPRVTAALRDAVWQVSENTVAALIREQGLAAPGARRSARRQPGRVRAGGAHRTRSGASSAPRGSTAAGTATGPEIITGEGKVYLDSVLDMGSRRIIGFALGARHDARLAYGALAMAVDGPGRCRSRRGLPHRSGQRVHRGQLPAGL